MGLYRHLLAALGKLGDFREEMKKTSVHLARKSAFAGVHPRKQSFVLTVKPARPLKNPRVFRSKKVSKSRWHHEVKIVEREDIDTELVAWLREAFELSA